MRTAAFNAAFALVALVAALGWPQRVAAVHHEQLSTVENAVQRLLSGENQQLDGEHWRVEPMELIPIDQWQPASAPSFLEAAVQSEGADQPLVCADQLVCPSSAGACCKGGKFCCPEACSPDGKTCRMTPMNRALEIARAKLRLEAQVEINSELAAKAKSERGTKRTDEQGQKSSNEVNMKKRMAEQQAALVKSQTETEQKVKDVKVIAEQGEKNRTAANEKARIAHSQTVLKKRLDARAAKAKAEKAKLDQEHAAKVEREKHALKKGNFKPRRRGVCAAPGRFQEAADAYTFTFWIQPQFVTGKQTELFSVGDSSAQATPGVYVLPSSGSSFKIRVVSSTKGDLKAHLDPPHEFEYNKWVFVAVQHQAGENGAAQVIIDDKVSLKQLLKTGPFAKGGKVWCARDQPAGATISDLRYYAEYLNATRLAQIRGQKHFKETAEQMHHRKNQLDTTGLCTVAKKCAQGWADKGTAGMIMQKHKYKYNPFGGGGGFNSGWTWSHPRLCCATSPIAPLEGQHVMAKRCPRGSTAVQGLFGAILNRNDYPKNPFARGGGFNSGWTWTHPKLCNVYNSAVSRHRQMCLYGVQCPKGWKDRGAAGIILRNQDYKNNPFGKGGAFNSGWTWTHPRLCCLK